MSAKFLDLVSPEQKGQIKKASSQRLFKWSVDTEAHGSVSGSIVYWERSWLRLRQVLQVVWLSMAMTQMSSVNDCSLKNKNRRLRGRIS